MVLHRYHRSMQHNVQLWLHVLASCETTSASVTAAAETQLIIYMHTAVRVYWDRLAALQLQIYRKRIFFCAHRCLLSGTSIQRPQTDCYMKLADHTGEFIHWYYCTKPVVTCWVNCILTLKQLAIINGIIRCSMLSSFSAHSLRRSASCQGRRQQQG